jgi:anti-sigma regulatory factor (Ser/Thr protein kinase)
MKDSGDKVVSREGRPQESVAVLKIKALLEHVPLAIEFVTKSARMVQLDDQELYQLQLAVDEACANVVEHAYQGAEPGDMEIACFVDDQEFTIQVRDWGRGFDPDNVLEPDVDAPLERRTLGGLGLFLVRQVMDRVEFTFDPERGNELLMVKKLGSAG